MQIELEKEAKESLNREKGLVERSLEAEQRLAEAMRKVGFRWLRLAAPDRDPPALPPACLLPVLLQHYSMSCVPALPQQAATASEALEAQKAAKRPQPSLCPSPTALSSPRCPPRACTAAGGGRHR